ncbi:MAG: amidohydrolase family protein [Opitutia bacterium]|jgi:L-fuconolactonase
MRLDAHQHFWSYDAAQYPWIPSGSPLHRDWLPDDLAALQRPLGLEGSVAVQARQTLAESDWLLALADRHPRIKAVVGWVDLRSDRVEADLARLAAHPKFVGVRHVVQDEPDDAFMLGRDFQRGIAKLHAHGLTYDILIYPKQLEAAVRLAEAFPLQPFVLDHVAKPPVKSGALEPWAGQLRRLARLPNVHCKVSGLITEADHRAWRPEDLRPYLDVVFEAFGPARLMWGSDWPVCLFAGAYERTFRVVDDYAVRLTAAERDALFGGNAAKFYGVA